MYSGDDLLLTANASNPLTGHVTRTATLRARAYAPTKDPRTNLTDRGNPDATLTLSFDRTAGAFTGAFDTTGWAVGTWTLLVDVSGELTGHSYATVSLSTG